jgi:hypothetical protein
MPVRNRHSEFDDPLYDGGDPPRDPFAPPAVPVEVRCMVCGQVYESWQLVWVEDEQLPGEGVWCCPTIGCDGIGFGFDILPTNPDEPADDDDGWREQDNELSGLDGLADDLDLVDPTDDTLDESAADQLSEKPEATDEATDPSSAYLTRALVYELLHNNDDWYHFFHQRDPRDPRAEREKPGDTDPKVA